MINNPKNCYSHLTKQSTRLVMVCINSTPYSIPFPHNPVYKVFFFRKLTSYYCILLGLSASLCVDLARDIGFKDPRVLQSMVICKQPRIGGEVRPHQDAAFLYTRPTSAVGFWFAMEGRVYIIECARMRFLSSLIIYKDCTKDNGCMWFVPGSHRGKIAKRFVRNPNGKGTVFMATGDSSIEPAESEYICTETPAGCKGIFGTAFF